MYLTDATTLNKLHHWRAWLIELLIALYVVAGISRYLSVSCYCQVPIYFELIEGLKYFQSYIWLVWKILYYNLSFIEIMMTIQILCNLHNTIFWNINITEYYIKQGFNKLEFTTSPDSCNLGGKNQIQREVL
jgi:hypothetical protein